MPTPAPDLILRAIQGREQGLMVIGSADALERLGTQLLAASTVKPIEHIPAWPPVVAHPTVSGPYLGEPTYTLSFNVLREDRLPKSLPLRRRGLPLWFSVVVGLLAIVGAVTIIVWVV